MDEERFGVSELADEAGVSVRTVRYYIAEGLLPPPVVAGARSYYTRDHLDRLKVIGQLKDAFLPLREIRRQLSQYDDATIREIAAEIVVERDAPGDSLGRAISRHVAQEIADAFKANPPGPSAADFIYGRDDLRPPAPPRRPRRSDPPAPPEPPEPSTSPSSASSYIARVLGNRAGPAPPAPPTPQSPTAAARTPEPTPAHDEPAWRRVRISDDAELLIRDDAFQRRRDKIDWLVDWARKVLE